MGGAVLMSLSVGFQGLTLPAPRWMVVFLGELNDLIQAGTGLGDAGVTELLERMREALRKRQSKDFSWGQST